MVMSRLNTPQPPPAGLSLNSPSTPHGSSPLASPAVASTPSPAHSLGYAGGLTASPTRIEQERGLVIPTDRTIEELEEKWLHKLGRLRVDREVVLTGYALYGIRPWFLSRTHWAHTIVTQTGKPSEHITCYVLVPEPDLAPGAREQELAAAIRLLADETRSHPKKTEHGTLLVTSPVGYGQEITPISGGDFRDTRPYVLLNTGLRRLGCGGRAAMGMESPLPAVRRKFYEYYRFPAPPGAPGMSLSRAASPTASPTAPSPAGSSPTRLSGFSPADPILHDPILTTVVETVRLVQAALALWGLYMPDREPALDGMFCDETKAAIFMWRRDMGMEHEGGLKLEKETSGGCIDPKTLAALLSSVTSTRYQLTALGVEKLPKDPFASTRRFLDAWQGYLASVGKTLSWPYLCVPGLHVVSGHYVAERKGHPDPLKVHRLLLSGVASATSTLSANLKGGADDTPLRKREHLRRHDVETRDYASGLELIVADADVGVVAPPDIITTDLEAYTRGVLKSKEKEWDVMGARRIAALWSGHPGGGLHLHGQGFRTRRLEALGRRRPTVIDEDDDGEGRARHAFKGMTAKTGQALRDGFGLVAKRGATYETSDSEGGRQIRRKQSAVPTVVEPDVEEIDDQLRGHTLSPSPSHSGRHLEPRPMKRPTIVTSLSEDGSEGSYRSCREEDWRSQRSAVSVGRERRQRILSTASDSADVEVGADGMEWTVVGPVGTGKGQPGATAPRVETRREQLAADVELCAVVLELRARERDLAKRARDVKALERSVFVATQSLIDAIRDRRAKIDALQAEAAGVERELHRAADDVDDDEALSWAGRKIEFYLSEDVNTGEVAWSLRELGRWWERMREGMRKREREAEEGRGWWWLGLGM
ncbi:hypothetical protein Q5752_006233 [Cryptotrichosporon argae]